MQKSGVLRIERSASAASTTTIASSQSCHGFRENKMEIAASRMQKKNAAWFQSNGAGFHSAICGRNHSTLATSQRGNSIPYGFASSATADKMAENHSHKMILRGGPFSIRAPMKSGANVFRTFCAVAAPAAAKSRSNPASTPPCVLIQSANNGGNAKAQRHFSAMNLPENPKLHRQRERGENLRPRARSRMKFPPPPPRRAPRPPVSFLVHPLCSDGKRDEKCQQTDDDFQQQQTRSAERAKRQGHCRLRQNLVIDPLMARCRPRIRVGSRQMSRLQQMFAVKDVAPKVGVGGVFGKLKNGEAHHANDKRPLQKGMFSCWRVSSCGMAGKYPLPRLTKDFYLTE